MRRNLFLIILFLIGSKSFLFGQQSKISFFKDSKIKIISYTIDKDVNGFPLLTFTILNSTRKDIVFTKLLLNLKYFKRYPLSSSSNNTLESKELKPIGYWDLSIPNEINIYEYSPKYPISISFKDSETIQIRISYALKGKFYVPSQVGAFKFSLIFMTYDNKGLQSSEITL